MRKTMYHYRILTTVDLARLSDEGRNVKLWLSRHIDKLTPLWADAAEQSSKRFFGYLLPRGLRLPLGQRIKQSAATLPVSSVAETASSRQPSELQASPVKSATGALRRFLS